MCDSPHWTHTMVPKWEEDPKTEADCDFCGKCNSRSRALKRTEWFIDYNCTICGDYGCYDLELWKRTIWDNATTTAPIKESESEPDDLSVEDFKRCGYYCGIKNLTLTTKSRVVYTSFCKNCNCQFRYELDEWEPYWLAKRVRVTQVKIQQ
jgi:transcription elongation factor Elf1